MLEIGDLKRNSFQVFALNFGHGRPPFSFGFPLVAKDVQYVCMLVPRIPSATLGAPIEPNTYAISAPWNAPR